MRGTVHEEQLERSFSIEVPNEELESAHKLYLWMASLGDRDTTYDLLSDPNSDLRDGAKHIELWSHLFLDIVHSIAELNEDDYMMAMAIAQNPKGDIIGTLSLLCWSLEQAAKLHGTHFARLHEHLKHYMTVPEAQQPPYIKNTKMV